MAPKRAAGSQVFPETFRIEKDRYKAEFAALVDRHAPSRTEAPSEWLGRLPQEVFQYYRQGLASFGGEVSTPVERRGRLYLAHTAAALMWMSWGQEAACERFRAYPKKGVRRAASLVTLECYRRGGVVARFESSGWFFRPLGQVPVSLISAAIRRGRVENRDLREALSKKVVVRRDVDALSGPRASGAVPSLSNLPLA